MADLIYINRSLVDAENMKGVIPTEFGLLSRLFGMFVIALDMMSNSLSNQNHELCTLTPHDNFI